jgi:uncharacterized membrane protein
MAASPPISTPSAPISRPKYVLFALIALMTAYVLVHTERFLIEPEHPTWQHFAPVRWWLYPHALAGTLAMLAAPLQFSDRLRERYAGLHRISGRVYVAAIFALAPLGAYVQYLQEATDGTPRSFTILAVTNAVLLIVPTAIAFRYAMQRRITQHRQWMVRSFAVALVFFEGRFIIGVTGWESNNQALIEPVIWSCLVLSLLWADLINQWQDRKSTR